MPEATIGLDPEPFLRLDITVDRPVSVGIVDGIERRMVAITGGTVSGRHSGCVLPGGADWQAIAPAGTLDIAARYLLEIDGGIVEVRSDGLRHAAPEVLARLDRGEAVPRDAYYFRTAVRFRTGAPALAHLNSLLAVAAGERLAGRVLLDLHAVT